MEPSQGQADDKLPSGTYSEQLQSRMTLEKSDSHYHPTFEQNLVHKIK